MNLTKRTSFVGALAALCLLAATPGHAQAPFKIGQPAPEFKAGRWIKKGPVTKLETGQIYVIEFWATWCGPCIAAMPHLSELAHKHAGKVTMVGVNILEHSTGEKAERNVDRFIEQKGQEVDYNVCRDTADDYLKKNWFDATRSPGIPETVVVDAQGKIAWIGHPIKLDAVLDDLLAGRFDYEKSATEHTKATSNNEGMMKVFTEYGEAMKAKDWAKAVAIVDDHPEQANNMWLMRFMALLHLDPAQALVQAKEAGTKKERSAGSLLTAIARADDLPRELYLYANETMGRNPQTYDFTQLAMLAWRLGDSAKAVEYQLKFKDFMMNRPERPTPEIVEMIEGDLKKYQGKE